MLNDSKGRAGLELAYAFANMPTVEFSLSVSLSLLVSQCTLKADGLCKISESFLSFSSVILLVSTHLFYLTFNKILQMIITCNLVQVIFSK
jgi:hypothetical protein